MILQVRFVFIVQKTVNRKSTCDFTLQRILLFLIDLKTTFKYSKTREKEAVLALIEPTSNEENNSINSTNKYNKAH